MSSGKVVEIIGAVVDVQFPMGEMPKVYDALRIEDKGLTLEVQQQLGDGIARCIAIGSTQPFPSPAPSRPRPRGWS